MTETLPASPSATLPANRAATPSANRAASPSLTPPVGGPPADPSAGPAGDGATARPAPPVHRGALWIGGRWTPPDTCERFTVLDPAREEVVGSVPAGTADEARRAVEAAAAAFPGWAALPLEARLRPLRRLLELLEADAGFLADTIAREVGMPRHLARGVQVEFALGVLRSYLETLPSHPFEQRVGGSVVLREPVGVVACITPWNVPLLLVMQKLVPALAVGCTVVLKPSELAPLNTFRLADLLAECDLPPGVVNLVSGAGPVVGSALAEHPGVAMVSLTGSQRAGRSVSTLAAGTVKRVHLELGGKSANIVLDDADLETAVGAGIRQACFNSGQACLAWSRLLVPEARYGEAVEIAAATAASLRTGDPFDPRTDLGPLISGAARARVRDHIRLGEREGARLVAGGAAAPEGLDRGFYVRPTVFADVHNGMRIAREEIFGPVTVLIPYVGEDDAVRIANDSDYGLHGAVWSASTERALAVARRIRTGRVDVNGAPFNLLAPFGGYKRSGNGRELGDWGVEAFCEVKAVQIGSGQAQVEIGAR
ncbi:aldehyde dehydrogenase [Planomonospora sphaerica]|uniref:Aldehyde dehydrogenase n=1 Tax=Planomonospora sphaerica TaxID=161355 RepID=A0A161LY63_9ACTN|nr:aldehyde dehydrogenase family protein [Planomonospora sphaerica]GAT70679.1 aldehyde dehydrogenase [Planomonospora sphaerica]